MAGAEMSASKADIYKQRMMWWVAEHNDWIQKDVDNEVVTLTFGDGSTLFVQTTILTPEEQALVNLYTD